VDLAAVGGASFSDLRDCSGKIYQARKEEEMAKTSFVPNPARIKVIGLGGGGCNAITRMVREEIQGVEFIAMNTDAQALAITEGSRRKP
jgi:cell division GTPase FtsZ